MKILFATLLCVSTIVSFAASEARDSFKVGTGFAGTSQGSGISADIAFPSLFHFNANKDKTRMDVHLYLDFGYEWYHYLAQSGGSFTKTDAGLVGAGLRMQSSSAEGTSLISPYSVIGADVAFIKSSLATQNTSIGLKVGLGADVFFVRGLDSFLGTSDSAFFVEANLLFYHRRADAVTGSPRFRDGFAPRIGYRSHF